MGRPFQSVAGLRSGATHGDVFMGISDFSYVIKENLFVFQFNAQIILKFIDKLLKK